MSATIQPTNRPKKRRKWVLPSILVLAALSVGVFMAFRKRDETIIVQTEKVARRNITETVVANGRIQPVLQVVINPEVSGEIVDLPVKEGQPVKAGDLLVKIKPDNYVAGRNSARATYQSALAGQDLAKANLEKAEQDFARTKQLYDTHVASDSQFLEAKTTLDVMRASHMTSIHQVAQARATLDRAEDDLSKTTIVSPIEGVVTKLRSQKGERVVGTAMMAGTEVMTVAKLDQMEARVDIGEMDVVLIKVGQKAKLEVEAFHDKKFNGVVTEIANAAKGLASATSQQSSGSSSQEATKFEVKILLTEPEEFRPGMSVTAEILTRSKTNVLAVPIMSVTTRMPKDAKGKGGSAATKVKAKEADPSKPERKGKEEGPKPQEVVFLLDGEKAKMAPVKIGISDDSYMEITEGLQENSEVISGGYAAISHKLEDQKKVKKGEPEAEKKEKS